MTTPEPQDQLSQPENTTSLGERPMDTPAPVSLPPEPADSSEREAPATAREAKVNQRDRMKDRQAKLDHHRESVLAGIAKLHADLDKLSEEKVDQRLSLRKKIKTFEDELGVIGEEQADLDRLKDVIAREEGRSVIEEAVRTRASLQKEGVEVAATLRKGLVIVGALFSEWRELRDRERMAKDTVRSLAPQRMGECPDFSYTTCVHPNFEQAIASALSECQKSLEDLDRRGRPLEPVMQERIEREQEAMK